MVFMLVIAPFGKLVSSKVAMEQMVPVLMVLFAITAAIVVYSLQRKQSVLDFRGSRIELLDREIMEGHEARLYGTGNMTVRQLRNKERQKRLHDLDVMRYFAIIGSVFSFLLLTTLLFVMAYATTLDLQILGLQIGSFVSNQILLFLIIGSILSVYFTVGIYLEFYNYLRRKDTDDEGA